jgi:hypothetical protein
MRQRRLGFFETKVLAKFSDLGVRSEEVRTTEGEEVQKRALHVHAKGFLNRMSRQEPCIYVSEF